MGAKSLSLAELDTPKGYKVTTLLYEKMIVRRSEKSTLDTIVALKQENLEVLNNEVSLEKMMESIKEGMDDIFPIVLRLEHLFSKIPIRGSEHPFLKKIREKANVEHSTSLSSH